MTSYMYEFVMALKPKNCDASGTALQGQWMNNLRAFPKKCYRQKAVIGSYEEDQEITSD